MPPVLRTLHIRGDGPAIALDLAGEGPLLLFLHGIGGNRTNWSEALRHFGGRFTAAAWDARGYGLSEDDDPAEPRAHAAYAADLLRVLDGLGVARAHLCGLSMGGRIAMDFAVRHPARVASLVLADTHLGFGHFTAAEREEFVRLRCGPLEAGRTPREMAPAVARTLMGPEAGDAVFDRLVESMAALRPVSYMRAVACMVQSDRFDAYPAIAAPTLVLAGECDRLTPPAMGREIAARIPGARFAAIPRAGHLANIEAPAAFNALVETFLDEVGA
ncbi:alpha/beta fold hydrolase [Falsiroseomonas oryzae]|uniref:alpha/beta fold hydrolase n=1 Tax=Falsiroseomonas oryzae TaxID=2766473 RepID=UPI0022EABD19|nr:alpha/beta fold hydrolase [Roseomonas sp. MO-31]